MITFSDVDKSFQTGSTSVDILKSCSWNVAPGAFVSVMGPSGTGKTTILNLIAGLEQASGGSVTVSGTALEPLSDNETTVFRGKTISFIFQQFLLLPQLTVAENIDLSVQLNRLERRFTTPEILAKVGLTGRGGQYPSTLSGGEQQRVAIARAFVGATPILLADEPTGNLDQTTARSIMELMTALHKEVGNTIIMITHDRDIAAYADTHYVLEDHILVANTDMQGQ